MIYKYYSAYALFITLINNTLLRIASLSLHYSMKGNGRISNRLSYFALTGIKNPIIDRQEDTPFLTALKNIHSTVPHQFFFPGHSSGKFIPDLLKDVIFNSRNPFEFDLPELDGLDNVHQPKVSLKI
jgi:hypothetical protein